MIPRRYRRPVAGLAVLAATVISAASGGSGRSDVRGLGMAGSTLASSGGLQSLSTNPANLGRPGLGTVEISLLPFGAYAGSDFITYGMYLDYFTGIDTDSGRTARHLDDGDKQSILGAFPGATGRIGVDVEARYLAIGVRIAPQTMIALSVTDHLAMAAEVPRAYAEFLFYGNTPGSVYDFTGAGVDGHWLRSYGLSAGTALPAFGPLSSFAAGVTVKAVHGFGYSELIRSETRLVTSDQGELDGTIDVLGRVAAIDQLTGSDDASAFTPFPAPAGSGFGVDLGVTGGLGEAITAAVSITDVGSIRWKRNVEELRSSATIHLDDPLDEAQRDSIENAVKGERVPGEAFSTGLPTVAHLGVSVEVTRLAWGRSTIPGELIVNAQYDHGLSDMASVPDGGRLALGMEYAPIPLLAVRAGMAFGGGIPLYAAFGVGFRTGVFDLDLAVESVDWIFSPRSFSSGAVALGMTVRI